MKPREQARPDVGRYLPGTYPGWMIRWPKYSYRITLASGRQRTFSNWSDTHRALAELGPREVLWVERASRWPVASDWQPFDFAHPQLPDGWTYDAEPQLVTIPKPVGP